MQNSSSPQDPQDPQGDFTWEVSELRDMLKIAPAVTQAERRLEVLDGYLIAFLNLDEVIRIIREEDEPKRTLMDAFELSDVQAEAVLNLRLRALRRLEEGGIRQEHADLKEQRKVLKALLKDKKKRWQAIAAEIRSTRDNFGKKTAQSTVPHESIVI